MASDAVPGFGPPLQAEKDFHVSIVARDEAEADLQPLGSDAETV
jgi:hypothetical protein